MKTIDSGDTETQQPGIVHTGSFDEVYAPAGVEVEIVRAPKSSLDSKHAAELAFNEQLVEVIVHESTDLNAENPVFTSCNGVSQYFFRGQPTRVKRKYVAILAAAKEHSVSTFEHTEADGTRAIGVRKVANVKYPFSVIHDPAGKQGSDWLRSLLRAAT